MSRPVSRRSIATATGGSYFFSPDELSLFEIYNVARAATADIDIAFEDTVALGEGDSGRVRSFARFIQTVSRLGDLTFLARFFFFDRGGQAINFHDQSPQLLDPGAGFSHFRFVPGNSRCDVFSLGFQAPQIRSRGAPALGSGRSLSTLLIQSFAFQLGIAANSGQVAVRFFDSIMGGLTS